MNLRADDYEYASKLLDSDMDCAMDVDDRARHGIQQIARRLRRTAQKMSPRFRVRKNLKLARLPLGTKRCVACKDVCALTWESSKGPMCRECIFACGEDQDV